MLALALLCLVGGCQPKLTRPLQDNFTIHAGSTGIRPFVAALERAFDQTADAEKLNVPDSDSAEMFAIHSANATVVINPVPDDRCNPNASMHSTYKQAEYRIDLVYETNTAKERETAKQLLLKAASDAGRAVATFKEC
jgi:hypothetical protein